MTFSQVEQLTAFDEAQRTFQMDEDAFRAFYELTARPVCVYLVRMTGDSRLADDLLQDAYYRLLRTTTIFESEAHRRNYLFRIATNLVRDYYRRPKVESSSTMDRESDQMDRAQPDTAERAVTRLDLHRAMARLKPRERSLLWLAYAQGFSHQEIAASLGLRATSLKALLFRARRHLLSLLNAPSPSGRRS